jgi:hypothetical protein
VKRKKYTVEEVLLLHEREQARMNKEPSRALEHFRYRDPAMSVKFDREKKETKK